jgi:hypothetical protein
MNPRRYLAIAIASCLLQTSAAWLCGQTNEMIYSNSLQNAWVDDSWAEDDLTNTNPVLPGFSNSISVSCAEYGALYLSQTPSSSAYYTNLTFWLNGGETGGQVLTVTGTLDEVDQNPYTLPALPSNTWQEFVIPLSAIDVADQPDFDGIWIWNNTDSAIPTFYVDDIYLVAGPPPPPPSPPPPPNPADPDFGTNVIIFNPSMPMATIQSQLSSIFASQQNNQFGPSRYACFFEAGQYSNLDVNLGYYTQVIGLGQMPDDVVINGNVHSEGVLADDNATVNFWRGCENMAVIPTNNDTMTWAVSQDTWLRRMHIKGSLNLSDTENGAYSSGGFLADSSVDSTVSSITQQQWLSRNDVWGNWSGQVWNMVFVGVSNPPSGTWPNSPYTVITNTPYIAEKPYLYIDTNGNYNVMVPALETNGVSGTTWASGPTPGVSLSLSQFYLAQAGVDNAASINAALAAGRSLIFTPGIYNLTNSILVTLPDTIVLGLGFPTLLPTGGFPTMVISDVNGVKVAGIIFDAGTIASPSLLEVGSTNSTLSHWADPICLYDICSRVGGETAGTTTSCVTINANDVLGDNLWLWRADHGTGVGWTQNACNNGLIVNGDRVTMYGLFVEHHEQYQTLWNGNWGRLYFYQSELPYDPPSQAAWSHAGVNGYASYKVADQVTSYQAYGLGIYAVFIDSDNISCFDAIETPTNSQQVNVHDMVTVYIAGDTSGSGASAINHIINGTGPAVSGPGYGGTATANYLWLNPTFSINSAMSGTNVAICFPTDSWHSYQLQYKNALTNGIWLDLGGPVGGNDILETVTDTLNPGTRFYQVESQ